MANAPRPLRILVCGSRTWQDRGLIRRVLSALPKRAEVVHGGCRGADVLAGEVAEELGLQVRSMPADWHRYGRSAGPIRNQAMLDLKPTLVLAFATNLAESRGTKNTVDAALARKIPVFVYDGTQYRMKPVERDGKKEAV